MSRALDQIILEDVAKTCPEPFLNYHTCMQTPNQDKNECLKYQYELQKCIKEEVPSFIKIQKNCFNFIDNYEDCLIKNPKDGAKCVDELNDLKNCSYKAVGSSELENTETSK